MRSAKFDVVLSDAADDDLSEILEWTAREHSAEMARRYQALILQALRDIAQDPMRPGSSTRPEIAEDIRFYHLRYSRKRVSSGQSLIPEPRHFIIYFVVRQGLIEVLRILHDSRDLPRQLQDS